MHFRHGVLLTLILLTGCGSAQVSPTLETGTATQAVAQVPTKTGELTGSPIP